MSVHTNEMWSQLEPTPVHLTLLILGGFLILYVLFSNFIRNRLHLSEPPLALLLGIALGPRGAGILTPNNCGINGCRGPEVGVGGWGWGDPVVQEITRVIVGIQVFAVAVNLPNYYISKRWKSILALILPIMGFGWVVCAILVHFIFVIYWPTAFTIAACLTPTDPVLAASILSNSKFSGRIPKRIKDLLSVESGCNDGTSFPFLYIGIFLITQPSIGVALKEWFLITILWQCAFGIFIGLSLGHIFNKILLFSEKRRYVDEAGFTSFYLLLAVASIGLASTLGVDDFLVAFGAGYGFARDGKFREKTKAAHLPQVIDMMLNSAMFVYLGTIIPWADFSPQDITPNITPWRLTLFAVLVLLFRRIPIMLATYRWIPGIHSAREALFCGHFGPMGLGGLFLAIEARALFENGTSSPEMHPPPYSNPPTVRERAIQAIWPIVCWTVMWSTIIHGLSVLGISTYSHFARPIEERTAFLAAEADPLDGMNHDDDESEDSESVDALPVHAERDGETTPLLQT